MLKCNEEECLVFRVVGTCTSKGWAEQVLGSR